jgi:Cu(I)/Ag(I) efflux system membrane fusion protein
VETANPDMQLKPEMYATATIKASLKQYKNQIVIPKSAVLWTGKRSIVYVKQPDTETLSFLFRQIELGPSLGDSYVVISGLEEGEEIVTNGAFSIDASAQLEGKYSMMNTPEAGVETSHEASLKHRQITVQGNCEMCKERIEKAAKVYGALSSTVWDADTKLLHINYYDDDVPDHVARAVAKAGHDNEKYKADDKVYNTLPECCQYRK